jgi:hypothetical protein
MGLCQHVPFTRWLTGRTVPPLPQASLFASRLQSRDFLASRRRKRFRSEASFLHHVSRLSPSDHFSTDCSTSPRDRPDACHSLHHATWTTKRSLQHIRGGESISVSNERRRVNSDRLVCLLSCFKSASHRTSTSTPTSSLPKSSRPTRPTWRSLSPRCPRGTFRRRSRRTRLRLHRRNPLSRCLPTYDPSCRRSRHRGRNPRTLSRPTPRVLELP